MINKMSELPIESIRVTRVAAKGGFNEQLPEETSFLFLEQFFDKKNNKIKEIILSEEGDEEQIIYYNYDDEGKIISEKHHFLFDEIEEETEFLYEQGLLIEKKKKYSYGSVETTVYKYNSDKLPISILVLDEDGQEEESEFFEYEGKNLIHYLKQNALIGKETEVWCKFDEKNRLIEEQRWSHTDFRTLTTLYDYTNNEDEPQIKIKNDKGTIIEAHIKEFNERKQLVKHEIQLVNNGLKTFITSYEYNDLDKISFLETVNQNGIKERSVIAHYDEKGLLISEIKSEYEVAISNINTFTLNYEYTFHQ
jgi:hypothetical protein